MTQVITHDDVNKWIGQAVAVRNAIHAIESRHKEELKEPKEIWEMLLGRIQQFFTDSGLTKDKASLSSSAGTAYLLTRYKASLADPASFMEFVIANKQFGLLDRKANVTAVRAYVKANKLLPTGVNLTSETKVHIRRPGQKYEDEE